MNQDEFYDEQNYQQDDDNEPFLSQEEKKMNYVFIKILKLIMD